MSVFDKNADVPDNNAFEIDEPEMEIDLFSPEKPSNSAASSDQPIDCSDIQIMEKIIDGDYVKLELNVDRRKPLKVIHQWFSNYLNVDKCNLQMFKFYREHGDGFAVNLSSSIETIQSTLSDIHHVHFLISTQK
jgi:hypothetical protein